MNHEALKKNARNYDAHASSWDSAMNTNAGHIFLEKPAMEQLLPETLRQKSVLCIGVGSGDEVSSLLSRNAQSIVGVDISEKLLALTGQKYPQVTTVKTDMHTLPFEDESFDLVYSSLTFHYSCDWDTLIAEVNRVIKLHGVLLFSTHNPLRWGLKSATGKTFTNDYEVTVTEHVTDIPGGVEITYCNHKDQQAIFDTLKRQGFAVLTSLMPKVIEVEPTDEQRKNYETLRAKNEENPLFLIIKAVKVT